MRRSFFLCALATIGPVALAAQATPTPKRDSAARADSVSRADSIALVRELEQMQSAGAPDTTGSRGTSQQSASNPRLLPDISVVGDFIADASPRGSTQEDGTRLGVRELEVAFQAAVDPYFRGDVFLGISDEEGIAIEQAYLTATALPAQLEARLGRFLMPFGKQNTTHRHDLHAIEYPYVIQSFFGPEGLKGTGIYLSRVFAPFGFYQEVIATAVDRFGERDESLVTREPANRKLGGLGYSARLRNYFDLSQAANVEVSFSGITGKREQPMLELPSDDPDGEPLNGYNQRQSVVAVDVTYRWRPLQQGLYKSFILQGELMQQRNPDVTIPELLGPTGDRVGGYAFARYQIGRRSFLGARYDFVDAESSADGNTTAASGYYEFFPSEFSKLVAGYERYMAGGGAKGINRLILQAAFSLGPHKPHPF